MGGKNGKYVGKEAYWVSNRDGHELWKLEEGGSYKKVSGKKEGVELTAKALEITIIFIGCFPRDL